MQVTTALGTHGTVWALAAAGYVGRQADPLSLAVDHDTAVAASVWMAGELASDGAGGLTARWDHPDPAAVDGCVADALRMAGIADPAAARERGWT